MIDNLQACHDCNQSQPTSTRSADTVERAGANGASTTGMELEDDQAIHQTPSRNVHVFEVSPVHPLEDDDYFFSNQTIEDFALVDLFTSDFPDDALMLE